MKRPPGTSLRGLRQHWRSDLIAGLSVALVALPLALGIATAAGAPPISGLVSAVVAGVITTFLRGSHVAINGPGNSLIVIVAAGFTAFGGGAEVFPHILGAVIVAGAIQVVFGVVKLGKLGDMIPSAVVQGMLAAIGLIIVGKQSHVMFGRASTARSPIDVFLELPESVATLIPAAALIGVLSLLVLIVHPRIKAKVVHFIPAPLWVVIVAAPIAFAFTSFDSEITAVLGGAYRLDPSLLVAIPDDLIGSLVRPDFSRIGEPAFWMVVLTLTLVTSLENIVSVKAVDKLDSYRRRSNLDRDLIGVGLSTVTSGLLGGLPVLTVVARSSVNVNHGAKTGWSNFFHGLVLLVFVLFLAPAIEEIALASLASILVYTGFKLAAPHVLRDALRKGPDHFLVFAITVIATLFWGLLVGIAVGLAAELMSHFLILGLPPREAFALLRETTVETVHEREGPYVLRLRGLANFLVIPRLRRALEAIEPGEKLIVDFTAALVVGNTLLEYCHEYGRRSERAHRDASFEVIGLEQHRAIADHPDALHAQERRHHTRRLTPRQERIAQNAKEHGWSFDARRDWDPDHLDEFLFFRIHAIEFRDTVVNGTFALEGVEIEFTLSDVTFDEGVVIPEVYRMTTLQVCLPFAIPELILDKEELLYRALELAGFQDIDFEEYESFSRRFLLQGPDERAIREFVTPELVELLMGEDTYHLESTGDGLVIFTTFMRLATARETQAMLAFAERLAALLVKQAGDERGA